MSRKLRQWSLKLHRSLQLLTDLRNNWMRNGDVGRRASNLLNVKKGIYDNNESYKLFSNQIMCAALLWICIMYLFTG